MINISTALIKIRGELKISAEYLGSELGVTGSYIHSLSKMARLPSQKFVMKLIEFCKKKNMQFEVDFENKKVIKALRILKCL